MTALAERNVLPGAVGGIVGGMPVVRCHGVPEGTPCGPEASLVSIHSVDAARHSKRSEWVCTYDAVMATMDNRYLLGVEEGVQNGPPDHEAKKRATRIERRRVLVGRGSKPRRASEIGAGLRAFRGAL